MITFMFPFRRNIMGGVQKLILEIGLELNRQGKLFKLIDYENGFVKHLLDQNGCEYVFCNLDKKNQIKNCIDTQDVLLLTNSYITKLSIIDYIPDNARLLFYDVYYPYFEQFHTIKGIGFNIYRKRILKEIVEKNGIIFMDYKGLEKVRGITKLSIDKVKVVPLGIHINKMKNSKFSPNDIIKISYIGRGEDWKIAPLINIIRELQNKNVEFELFIFTNIGEEKKYIEYFKKFIKKQNLKYTFILNKKQDSLEKELLKLNLDLAFGMGYSVLETAKLGIPTVPVPFGTKITEGIKYKWLCEYPISIFGCDIEEFETNSLCQEGYDIKTIVKLLKENYLLYSEQTYEYVYKNYSIKKIVNKLIYNCQNTNLTKKDISNFIISKIIAYKNMLSFILKNLDDLKIMTDL